MSVLVRLQYRPQSFPASENPNFERGFAAIVFPRYRLDQIAPICVAAYIEYLSTLYSPPTVKQHLAAIRMCFDWLVTGQIIPTNPAASVRGPKYVVKRGKTPVLSADEARQLLDSIDCSTLVGLRD